MPFTPEDQLQLLKLLARRSIAERRAQTAADALIAKAEVGEDKSAAESAAALPTSWRLLPESAELFPWQTEALATWLKQRRGTVKVATGGGKTWFALAAAQEAQRQLDPDLRVVIVVPTIPLMHQWVDDLKNSNLPPEAIGMLGGGQECQFGEPVRIVVAVLNSARRLLPTMVKKSGIAKHLLLVVDECHRAHAKESQQIFEMKAEMTLGLSATPESNADDGPAKDQAYAKSAAGKALGAIFHELTLAEALEAGLLAPFEVHHVGVPLTGEEGPEYERLSRKISELRKDLQVAFRKSRSNQGFLAWCQTKASRGGDGASAAALFVGLAAQRKRLLYRAQLRHQAVLGILQDRLTNDASARCITFHEVIDQVDELYLGAIKEGLPAVLEHSKLSSSLREESLEAFRSGVARIIISARSLVEGFNVPSADVGVIAASSSSVRQRIQSLGRMLRRKEGGRIATVYVLYALKTEDERIYEQADWDHIIGAQRNRFFHWFPDPGQTWPQGLVEVDEPPRTYLPHAEEIDQKSLVPGEPWPARPDGIGFHIDQDGNLRDEEEQLFALEEDLRARVLEVNPGRRMKLTSTGHLIAFRSVEGEGRGWIYIGKPKKKSLKKSGSKGTGKDNRSGKEDSNSQDDNGKKVVLRLRQARGIRRLAQSLGNGQEAFALLSDLAKDPKRGRSAEIILSWVKKIEGNRAMKIHKVYWNEENIYWLEIEGEQISYPEPIPPLEFSS